MTSLTKGMVINMRILLAEDERSLSKAIVALLEKNNYSVDAVYDGEEALSYIEAGNYDAVILDIMMPKRDGISALREMRARGHNIPVLILSARSEVDDKVLGLDSGANDYLTKPFSVKELLARIRAMTRRVHAPGPDSGIGSAEGILPVAGQAHGPDGDAHFLHELHQLQPLLLCPFQTGQTEVGLIDADLHKIIAAFLGAFQHGAPVQCLGHSLLVKADGILFQC